VTGPEPPFPFAGETFSLLAALVWAAAVILLRVGGERVAPVALNAFKNAVALGLLIVTLLATGRPLLPAVPAVDVVILLVSGFLGLAVADSLFLAGLNRLGAGRAAIVDCLYSPFVFLCAAVHLGEPIGARGLLALALVVLAVLVGGWEPGGPAAGPGARRQLLLGVAMGALAMLTMSVGIVLAKPVLERTDTLWATTVRLAAGAIAPGLLGLATPAGRAALGTAFRPGPAWRVTLPAAVIGAYGSMLLWIAGFKYAHATVAGILNQTSTLFTLAFASLFLREPFTARRGVALVLGCAGALLASLSRG
jgi:drug/metabolite transporter (DMT)-like permease